MVVEGGDKFSHRKDLKGRLLAGIVFMKEFLSYDLITDSCKKVDIEFNGL